MIQLVSKKPMLLPLLVLSTIWESAHGWTPPILSTLTGPKSSTTQYTRQEVQALQHQQEQRARQYHDNQAWNALFLPVPERPEPMPMVDTEGTLPKDFPPGCLLRVGPNGADENEGWFDGDGMVKCITFPPRTAEQRQPSTISTTYIDTCGRKLEQQQSFRDSKKKFRGTLGSVPRGLPMLGSLLQNAINFQTLQAQKDTCNTAVAQHGGRLLALMEQCPPTELVVTRDGRVQTTEAGCSLDGAIDRSTPITGGALSAHGRTCPDTGERIHISYRADQKPYLRMDVFEPGFELKQSVGIDVPVPIFLHDCAITENYAVVMDLPLTLRTTRLVQDKFPVEYEPSHPARIGLVPRRQPSGSGDVKPIWFDCAPGVVLHMVNAWESEDGKKVTIQCQRSDPPPNVCYLAVFAASFFYEYELDLETGKVVKERCLNPNEIVEFPAIDERCSGKKSPYCYFVSVGSIGGPLEVTKQPSSGISIDGVTKFASVDIPEDNIQKGDVVARYKLPERWFSVSEPTVVPKTGEDAKGEYIVTIATHVPEGTAWRDVAKDQSLLTSKVFVLDGDRLEAGPVYSATLPYHVPFGLHSEFVEWDQMQQAED